MCPERGWTVEEKECGQCHQSKPLSDFWPARWPKGAYRERCKECESRPIPQKTCTKCGSPGPFYRQKSCRDGLTKLCIKCRREQNRLYYHTSKAAGHRFRRNHANKAFRNARRDGLGQADHDEIQRRIARVRELKMWTCDSVQLSTLDAVLEP